jgi:hypothetical protein
MQRYVWPDLIIVGGGVSAKHDKFLPLLSLDTRVVPALLRNEAGMIGAALAACQAPARQVEPLPLPPACASAGDPGREASG